VLATNQPVDSQPIVKTLVTGGTGFVGSHLVRVLLERGEHVRCLVRPTSGLDNVKDLFSRVVTGDLRDPVYRSGCCKGYNVVYHLRADYRLWCKDPNEMYQSNVEGSNNGQCKLPRMKASARGLHSTVGCLG